MDEYLSNIARLIIKHLEERLTAEEEKELNEWLSNSEKERQLFSKLTDPAYVQEELKKFYAYDADAGWEKIQQAHHFPKDVIPLQHTQRRRYWMSAAAILVILSGAAFLYFYLPRQNKSMEQDSASTQADIAAPAISKATITLQDGITIAIDSVTQGTITKQQNTTIRKTGDGQLVYESKQAQASATAFNTITNPRGSKVIQLTLSDGTKVWLNVESEMRYPVAFTADTREVDIKGEVYFEVVKNPSQPFIVKVNGVAVQVTGTHFNVNAYKEESTLNVTLLEGGVKVSSKNNTVVLQPGQQAQVGDNIKTDKQADVEQVMAWKNGVFNFNGTDIHTIMRQLGRWYDVEVHFKDDITEHFYGDIAREKNISEVLNMLQTTGGIHFKTKEKKIEVFK